MWNFQEGETLYFNKPLHWTSFDLVNKVRYQISRFLKVKKIKVGHAGTLDPLATGVMIVCTGKATRHIESIQSQTKEYIATLRLGATTPSFDLETAIDRTFDTQHITQEEVERILPQFTGHIEQIPPAFSACKINGNRAYELARKGEEVALAPKPLIVDEIELIDFRPDQLILRIACSKGTYIRAMARDIGQALRSGAHLTALERTRIGHITLSDCLTIEQWTSLLATPPLPCIMPD
jgi:tRNA pseudouridine55 synthase